MYVEGSGLEAKNRNSFWMGVSHRQSVNAQCQNDRNDGLKINYPFYIYIRAMLVTLFLLSKKQVQCKVATDIFTNFKYI